MRDGHTRMTDKNSQTENQLLAEKLAELEARKKKMKIGQHCFPSDGFRYCNFTVSADALRKIFPKKHKYLRFPIGKWNGNGRRSKNKTGEQTPALYRKTDLANQS